MLLGNNIKHFPQKKPITTKNKHEKLPLSTSQVIVVPFVVGTFLLKSWRDSKTATLKFEIAAPRINSSKPWGEKVYFSTYTCKSGSKINVTWRCCKSKVKLKIVFTCGKYDLFGHWTTNAAQL